MTQFPFRSPRLTTENSLYLLAFVTGVIARFYKLGDALLGDGEAQAALQALSMVRSASESILGTLAASPASAQPLYTTLTALLFNMIKDSSALARLLPALTGSLLVLLPMLVAGFFPALRQAWRWFGVILAFALALDPGLVLLSRTAGSSMPGIFFTLLGFLGLAAFFLSSSETETRYGAIIAGSAFGAALLSGSALWIGLLIMVIALILANQVRHFSLPLGKESISPFLTAALVTIATLIIMAPVFLGTPFDLSGLGSSLAGLAVRLVQPSGVPALRQVAALAVYHPLAMIFGLAAVVRAWLPSNSPAPSDEENEEPTAVDASAGHTAVARWLSLWAAVALAVCLLLPGREIGDLVWVLIPLWALAAIQISNAMEGWLAAEQGPLVTASSVYTFLFLMLTLNLLNLNTLWPDLLARFQLSGALAQVSIIVAGIGLMLVIVSALFWLYWSPRLMTSALSLSTVLVLSLTMIGSAWSLSQLRPDSVDELWRGSENRFAAPGQFSELYATLNQASIIDTGLRPPDLSSGGLPTELEVVLVDPMPSSPALVWALRGFSLRTAAAVAQDENAGAIITSSLPAQSSNRLNTKYRGQDLIWQITPGWSGAMPPDPFTWLLDHQAPKNSQSLIVWVRGDLFPGGIAP